MSQVSKYKIKSLFKRRVKVAKMIAVDLEQHTGWPRGGGAAKLRVEALLTGAPFDVRAARELGEAMTGARPARPSSVRVRWHPFSLIAMFEHAEAEYAAALVIDVLRTNGDTWRAVSITEMHKYVEMHKPEWMSNPFIRTDIGDLERRGYIVKSGSRFTFTDAGLRKLAERSNGPDAVTRKRGRWLLDALNGQPSACQGKHGYVSRTGVHYRTSHTAPEPCPDCRGTGHNLGGHLPRVELDSPQLRRHYFDSGEGEEGRSWLRAVPSFEAGEGRMLTVNGPTKQTRVVPRGEHRWVTDPVTPHAKVSGYGPYRWSPESTASKWNADDRYGRGWLLMPGWRRGELLHHEQRRERPKE